MFSRNLSIFAIVGLLSFPCFGESAASKSEQADKDEARAEERANEKFKKRDEALKKRESEVGDWESKSRDEKKKTDEAISEASHKVDPYKMSFGFHAGINFANANLVPTVATSNKVGLTLGAFFETPVMPGFLFLQPEFDFVQKGSENTHFGPNANVRLNYLEIPVLLKAKFALPKIKPFVLGGITAGYLLSGSVDGAPGVTLSRFKSLEIGYVLGVGFSYLLGDNLNSPEFTLEARMGSGFSNLDSVAGEWTNRNFSLLAGIQF